MQYYIFVDEEECELSKCAFVPSGFWEAEGFIQQMGYAYEYDENKFLEAKLKLDKLIFHSKKDLSYELRVRVISPIKFIKDSIVENDEHKAYLKVDLN